MGKRGREMRMAVFDSLGDRKIRFAIDPRNIVLTTDGETVAIGVNSDGKYQMISQLKCTFAEALDELNAAMR